MLTGYVIVQSTHFLQHTCNLQIIPEVFLIGSICQTGLFIFVSEKRCGLKHPQLPAFDIVTAHIPVVDHISVPQLQSGLTKQVWVIKSDKNLFAPYLMAKSKVIWLASLVDCMKLGTIERLTWRNQTLL